MSQPTHQRISPATGAMLTEIARITGQTKTAIIESAVKAYKQVVTRNEKVWRSIRAGKVASVNSDSLNKCIEGRSK